MNQTNENNREIAYSIDEILDSVKDKDISRLSPSDKTRINHLVDDIISEKKAAMPTAADVAPPAEEASVSAASTPVKPVNEQKYKRFDEVFPNLTNVKSNQLDLDELNAMKTTPVHKPKPATPLFEQADPTLGDTRTILQPTKPSQTDDSYKKELLRFSKARKKKVEDFMLTPISDADDTELNHEEILEKNDFTSYVQAPDFESDITALSRTLSIKLIGVGMMLLLSLYLGLANTVGYLPLPQIVNAALDATAYVIGSLILLLAGGSFAYDCIRNGFVSIINRKLNRDTLTAVCSCFGLLSLIVFLCAPNLTSFLLYPIFSVLPLSTLFFNLWGRKLMIKRTILNFKLVSTRGEKHSTEIVDDDIAASELSSGMLGELPLLAVNRSIKFPQGFFTNSYASDATDAISKILVPAAGVFALVFGIIGLIRSHNVGTMLTTMMIMLSFFCPFSFCLCTNLPLYLVAKNNRKRAIALLGTEAYENVSHTNVVAIEACDLFPKGSIEIVGVKTFPGMRVDEAIVDAASVFCHTNSIFAKTFFNIISNQTELLRKVDGVVYEKLMGIRCFVDGRQVLIGSKNLIQNYEIEIPLNDFEHKYEGVGNNLVYLAIDGVLTVVFVIKLKPNPGVLAGLNKLDQYSISIAVRSCDSILTRDKLCELFDKDISMFKIIPTTLHEKYHEVTKRENKRKASILNNGSFYSFATSIISAIRLRGSVTFGLVTQIASIVLGIIIAAIYAILSSVVEIGFIPLLIYHTVWLVLFLFNATVRKK